MIRNLPSPPPVIDGKASIYTEAMIMRRIYEQIRKDGSVAAAARSIGVSKVFLSKVVKGEKPIGEKITAFFGFERFVIYLRKRQRAFTGVTYQTPRVEDPEVQEVNVNVEAPDAE